MVNIIGSVFFICFDNNTMGTKKKSKLRYIFANNLPSKDSEPVSDSEGENSGEEQENQPVDETFEEEEPTKTLGVIEDDESNPKVKYDPYFPPLGTPENGILLCIIISLITLFALGFLIYHEHTWRKEEEGSEVQVEDIYEPLIQTIKTYVRTIEDPNKEAYLPKLRKVYLDAAASSKDVDSTIDDIKTQSREILGFDEPRSRNEYEYEWQKLFEGTGIINTWLSYNNVTITSTNKKAIFKAIAEGLR